jgi:hypothetical protein
VGVLDELVGDADKVPEEGQQWLVIVVRGQAVLQEDALARGSLFESVEKIISNM